MDQLTRNKVPPHNYEAEIACLGAIILKNQLADTVFEKIKSDDFYDRRNQLIANSIYSIFNADHHAPIDLITLSNYLKENNLLTDCGGLEYLSTLVDLVPATSNAGYYAGIIRDNAIKRRMMAAGYDIVSLSSDPEQKTAALLEETSRIIHEISQSLYRRDFVHIKEVLLGNVKRMQDIMEKKIPSDGILTGYHRLDDILNGLKPGHMVIVGARTSMGKTTFCLNIAENIAVHASNPCGVGIFSLEMTKEDLGMRFLCSTARISFDRIIKRALKDSDWGNIIKAAEKLAAAPLYIDDTSSLTLGEIKIKARRMVEKGVKIIIIDYMQLVGSEIRDFSREREIAIISKGIKSLARELEIPVIAISQLSRSPEKRDNKVPVLSDLRESGSIEQDADAVIFIHRPAYFEKDIDEAKKNVAEIYVAKQRNGRTGKCELVFMDSFTRFENLSSYEES
ncbi:MAG: replicative DNA helicase [Spirochaetes bacterium GWF1_41_5]|nr:MAG: replicative DNA helicase [Spirochaetes bacterium GWF1_41_5]